MKKAFTKKEAYAMVKSTMIGTCDTGSGRVWVDCSQIVDVLERLGLLEFAEPEPLTELEALGEALSEALANNGLLTAARVSGFLHKRGFKIFWAPFIKDNPFK